MVANSLRTGPDERGRFGEFGGRFVAETLMPLILEVEQAYRAARADPQGENITRCVWQQGSDGLWRERASGISGVSLFRVGANDQTIDAYNRSRAACRTLGTETQGDAALRGRAVGEVTGFMKTHVIDIRVR